jgi:hypothetical protein
MLSIFSNYLFNKPYYYASGRIEKNEQQEEVYVLTIRKIEGAIRRILYYQNAETFLKEVNAGLTQPEKLEVSYQGNWKTKKTAKERLTYLVLYVFNKFYKKTDDVWSYWDNQELSDLPFIPDIATKIKEKVDAKEESVEKLKCDLIEHIFLHKEINEFKK